MARIVAAYGTSHSPMMVANVRTWGDGSYVSRDRQRVLVDSEGQDRHYEYFLTETSAPAQLEPALLDRRHAEVQAAMQRLRNDIAGAALDALIIVGDDQHELFGDDNMPSIGIYHGESIRNAGSAAAGSLVYPEPGQDRHYPCHGPLARQLIAGLLAESFDVATMARIAPQASEGHAFSFVHRFLMPSIPVPVVPVFLNAYYEPNQPSPARCFDLGLSIARIVSDWPANARVAIMASGGLSHFVVDEASDRALIAALRSGDRPYLRGFPLHKLRSGSSEIRNWICLAGAASGLEMDWITYVPGYRTPALTGTGLCLASFKEGEQRS